MGNTSGSCTGANPGQGLPPGRLLAAVADSRVVSLRLFELVVDGDRAGVTVRIDCGATAYFYNAGIDQTTLRPAVDVEYVLTKDGKEVFKQAEDWRGNSDAGQRLTLARLLPTTNLVPGEYEVVVRVRDKVSGQSLAPTAKFQVAANK